jgi:hypothetical protein
MIGGWTLTFQGDGATLVGKAKSAREAEKMDMVVPSGAPVGDEGDEDQEEFGDDDFSETSSMAVVEAHSTPRISPSISALNDDDVPHQSPDELPVPAIDEGLVPQHHEHPADAKPETTDWAATREVETTEIFNTKKIKETKEAEEAEEVHETEEIEEIEEAQDMVEMKIIDQIDAATDISVETEYQRFLAVENKREGTCFTEAFGSVDATEIEQEARARVLERTPWAPTVAWRKEKAAAPVRPHASSTSSQVSGTTTRMRKTSDSIKSLVEKFENLSPQNTPSDGA